jgi:transposase
VCPSAAGSATPAIVSANRILSGSTTAPIFVDFVHQQLGPLAHSLRVEYARRQGLPAPLACPSPPAPHRAPIMSGGRRHPKCKAAANKTASRPSPFPTVTASWTTLPGGIHSPQSSSGPSSSLSLSQPPRSHDNGAPSAADYSPPLRSKHSGLTRFGRPFTSILSSGAHSPRCNRARTPTIPLVTVLLDNWSGHHARMTVEALAHWRDTFRVVFVPPYSPDFNWPIECSFHDIKGRLKRDHHQGAITASVLQSAVKACDQSEGAALTFLRRARHAGYAIEDASLLSKVREQQGV